MSLRNGKVWLLAVLALGLALLAPVQQAVADERIAYIYYVEVFAPPDPSMGGNQALVAWGDSPLPPSYSDIGAAFGPEVVGGGGYTVMEVEFDAETGEVISSSFHSSGDFP